jgi:2-phosphosulfolactate phosphatase
VKEYSAARVAGKNLIFSSTNGTPALLKSKFARNCAVLGFTNISRVVEYIGELREDFMILCAGRNSEFSLEDTVCAGMLIYKLERKKSSEDYVLTDSARGALKLYSSYKKNLLLMLRESEHGRFLLGLDFDDDLIASSKVDSCPSLPVMKNGIIKLIESFETDPKLTMKKVANSQ